MRWALVFVLVSVLLSQVLAQDSTEDSPAPKRVLKKYRVRRPVVVDDQGNVVRAGPRLRRVRVKQPRPTVETAALQANPPQTVTVSQQSSQSVVLSTNPPRIRPNVASTPAPVAQPTQATRQVVQQQQLQQQQQQQQHQRLRKLEPVFIEDVPQVIEPVRTVPTYRQATPTANREALLANVKYKSRGGSSAQVLDEEEDDQKVGTIRNYSHINEDGSFTFGYEAADGSFKEETRGIDCVVRGKYGYVDPDGVRREFEYVSGNPCDPNAPKEEELQEEEEDDEISAPPPRPLLRRVRPEINENNLQGLQQVREEALSEDQLNQFVRPATRQRVTRPNPSTPRPRIRITTAPPTLPPRTQAPALVIRERPVSARPLIYQEPSQSLDSDRSGRLFNFDSEVQRLHQISRPLSQPQPLYEQPLQVVQRHPTPTIASQPSRQYFGGSAAFRQFNSPTAAAPTEASPAELKSVTAGPTLAPGERNPSFGRYRTELVYDPSSGQYTSVTVQAMPHSNQEIELTQKLRAFVEPQRSNQINIQSFGQPQVQYFGTPQQLHHQPQHTAATANGQIDQFLARNAYSQQRLLAQNQQQQQVQTHGQQQQVQTQNQAQIQNLQYYPQQAQLRPNPSPTAPVPQQAAPTYIQQQPARQYQFPSVSQSLDDSRNPANGQIDAFLRSLNQKLPYDI